jgi:predicted transcriptional regulator of viral defense system
METKKKTAKEIIYDIARENDAVVTVKEAKRRGVTPEAFRKVAYKDKSVINFAKGVYRIDYDFNGAVDYDIAEYKRAVAAGGEGAFVYGDSALEILDLALALPYKILIAVPRYATSAISFIKKVRYIPKPDEVMMYKGVPVQKPAYAFLSAVETPGEYLLDAIKETYDRNLISREDAFKVNDILEQKWKMKIKIPLKI